MLTAKKLSVDRAIEFRMDDAELVGRLSGRRTCTQCGAMYHVTSAPIKTPGVCDKCGGTVVQRDDDHKEVIQKRLKVYHNQTLPLVAFYAGQGKLKALDASLPMDQVTALLQSAIASA